MPYGNCHTDDPFPIAKYAYLKRENAQKDTQIEIAE
jgi:hypothetical protein